MTVEEGEIKIWGLGVGPGDPELITLKARRILQSADVIAYPVPTGGDSLVRAIAAPYFPAGPEELILSTPMVADRRPAQEVYDRTTAEIAERAEAGKTIVILCEGDPFFYGSFMYLFARLVEQFPVEVVPGVSSLTACSAVLGAPLAARNDTLVVLPAPLEAEELTRRLDGVDAAAIIKVGRHLSKVRGVLRDLGLVTRARYIERATMSSQRILALDEVADGEAPYFSMILVHSRAEAWR